MKEYLKLQYNMLNRKMKGVAIGGLITKLDLK